MNAIYRYLGNLILFIFLPLPLIGLSRGVVGGQWNTWLSGPPGHPCRAEREFAVVREVGFIWIGTLVTVFFAILNISIQGMNASNEVVILINLVWLICSTPIILKSYQVWGWNKVNNFGLKMLQMGKGIDRSVCVNEFIDGELKEAKRRDCYYDYRYVQHLVRVLGLSGEEDSD